MILIFLANGIESYELGSFIDIFDWNNNHGIKKLKIETASFHGRIKCTGRTLTIIPEKNINEINPSDYSALVVPGGSGKDGFYEDAYNEKFLELIRQFYISGKIIASVCTGALPVAKSGVLRNKKATTYRNADGRRRKELADYGAIVLDDDIVVDKKIITSSNPSTAVNVALKLLEMLTDKNNSYNIRELMGF